MTQEDIDMLRRAVDTHISQLFWTADAHKKNGNREAQMACLVEMRKYEALKKKL